MKNKDKIESLLHEISEKRDELEKEINMAIVNKLESAEKDLRERQLQCNAQIRLLKYILGSLTDKEYIIC